MLSNTKAIEIQENDRGKTYLVACTTVTSLFIFYPMRHTAQSFRRRSGFVLNVTFDSTSYKTD